VSEGIASSMPKLGNLGTR